MNEFQERLAKYAELIVKLGVDVQSGQEVLIRAPLFGSELVHKITELAYAQGAKRVHVEWEDAELDRLSLMHESLAELANVPEFKVAFYEQLAKNGAAVITVYSPDPFLLADVDHERIAIAQRAVGEAFHVFRGYLMGYKIPWCLVSIPNAHWAQSIFPELSVQDAVDKLWECIFFATRVNQEDPLQAWIQHTEYLSTRLKTLNNLKLTSLHYSGPGTQLEIQLPKGHVWRGGRRLAQTGQSFIPNIPAEEVFTAPQKDGVHGFVRSTKPLHYGGRLLGEFSIVFKDGRAVSIEAGSDDDAKTLQLLLDSSSGANYLGEVAIVPDNSPISELGIIFQNTLFDENAACHVALGDAYPLCIEGGDGMTAEELEVHGLNTSVVHVDFMIGSGELDIIGVRENGESIQILKAGRWVIESSN
ncbi:MAG: aminopeptidase [Acidibacillus sp.]|nr:aminopeptidase [Acidibacillus sp.]